MRALHIDITLPEEHAIARRHALIHAACTLSRPHILAVRLRASATGEGWFLIAELFAALTLRHAHQ